MAGFQRQKTWTSVDVSTISNIRRFAILQSGVLVGPCPMMPYDVFLQEELHLSCERLQLITKEMNDATRTEYNSSVNVTKKKPNWWYFPKGNTLSTAVNNLSICGFDTWVRARSHTQFRRLLLCIYHSYCIKHDLGYAIRHCHFRWSNHATRNILGNWWTL